MSERTFSMEDQVMFADLSGDRNPVHLEPSLARRTMFGGVLVHGLHTLLWSMDQCLPDSNQRLELAFLRVDFLKPVRLGDRVHCVCKIQGETSIELEVFREDTLTTYARLELQPVQGKEWPELGSEENVPPLPRDLQLHELEGRTSTLPLVWNNECFRARFATLCERLPPVQLAQLLAATRLVGMECPGLHSALVSLEFTFSGECAEPAMKYRVTEFDDRINLVTLDVSSHRLTGEIRSFVRPPAQEQASYQQLQRVVQADEFCEQRALVVGGSRGLGEVSAKLLAAGGADVCLTYCSGMEDAMRVRDDIRRGGGHCELLQLDVLAQGSLGGLCWSPTHLYYYATPYIFRGQAERFSPELFAEFCEYYVVGFHRLVSGLIPGGLLGVLYPSSVAVEELPGEMREYAAAKSAGEKLCQFLHTRQRLSVTVPRFSRLSTDQTANPLAENFDPIAPVLDSLRALSRQSTLAASASAARKAG